MIEYKIEDHASSFLPEHKKWKLVWSDEFDGDKLDESKWGFREYFWGKKSPTFTREGVYVDGESNLHMAMVKKGDDYFSAQLQTGAVVYDLPKDSKGFWPFGKFEKPKFMHIFLDTENLALSRLTVTFQQKFRLLLLLLNLLIYFFL